MRGKKMMVLSTRYALLFYLNPQVASRKRSFLPEREPRNLVLFNIEHLIMNNHFPAADSKPMSSIFLFKRSLSWLMSIFSSLTADLLFSVKRLPFPRHAFSRLVIYWQASLAFCNLTLLLLTTGDRLPDFLSVCSLSVSFCSIWNDTSFLSDSTWQDYNVSTLRRVLWGWVRMIRWTPLLLRVSETA